VGTKRREERWHREERRKGDLGMFERVVGAMNRGPTAVAVFALLSSSPPCRLFTVREHAR